MSKQTVEVIVCNFFSCLHFLCGGDHVADPRASFLLPKAFQPLSFCFIYFGYNFFPKLQKKNEAFLSR